MLCPRRVFKEWRGIWGVWRRAPIMDGNMEKEKFAIGNASTAQGTTGKVGASRTDRLQDIQDSPSSTDQIPKPKSSGCLTNERKKNLTQFNKNSPSLPLFF